jgi:AcrR family transcriptional regulator
VSRRGRRPGASTTRDDILTAARDLFAAHGYQRATLRAIAARAGTDPSLPLHYFGSKERLFAAAMKLPVSPSEVLPALRELPPGRVGDEIVRRFLSAWDDAAQRPVLVGLLRSGLADERSAATVRRFITHQALGPVARTLGPDDGPLRATLVGSQLVGLALLRYVARVEPLASAPVDDVAVAVGPTVERYLNGSLSVGSQAGEGPAESPGGPPTSPRRRRR